MMGTSVDTDEDGPESRTVQVLSFVISPKNLTKKSRVLPSVLADSQASPGRCPRSSWLANFLNRLAYVEKPN